MSMKSWELNVTGPFAGVPPSSAKAASWNELATAGTSSFPTRPGSPSAMAVPPRPRASTVQAARAKPFMRLRFTENTGVAGASRVGVGALGCGVRVALAARALQLAAAADSTLSAASRARACSSTWSGRWAGTWVSCIMDW